jgi:hypothetical protein
LSPEVVGVKTVGSTLTTPNMLTTSEKYSNNVLNFNSMVHSPQFIYFSNKTLVQKSERVVI